MMMASNWRSRTAWFMVSGLASTTLLPLWTAHAAAASAVAEPMMIAQLFSQPSSQVGLPAGTVIPVTYNQEKIIVTPSETSDVTLTVASEVRSPRGTVIIPAGSKIEGKVQPASGGSQFVSQNLVLANGRRYAIDAASNVVTRTETVSRRSNPDILKGAAIGAAAAAILSEIFGDANLGIILGGAGAGALASVLLRGTQQTQVVVIYPATDLNLRLQSNFSLTSDLLQQGGSSGQ